MDYRITTCCNKGRMIIKLNQKYKTMETKNNCKCDLSEIKLDMTVRECLEKCGFDPEKAQKFFQSCCKDCCGK